jgi:hypothetical protein
MRLITFFLLLFANCPAFATSFDVSWAKKFSGENFELAYSIGSDTNGNVYVTGYFHSPTLDLGTVTLTNSTPNGTNANAYVAKLGPSGNLIWARAAAGTTESSSIAVDPAGNSYITGRYLSATMTLGSLTLTNQGSTLPIEIYAAKLDTDGNVMWASSAGGTGNDTGFAIACDNIGQCYVAGWFRDAPAIFGNVTLTNSGSFNWFVAKYDVAGNVLWAKCNTGNSDSQPKGIAVDAEGNVYVTGRFSGSAIFGSTSLNASSYEFLLIKYNNSGTVSWARTAGGTGLDYGSSVAVDSVGNPYVTGYFESSRMNVGSTTLTNYSTGVGEFFTAKYDASGNPIWAKSAEGGDDDEGRHIAVDTYGNACVIGFFHSRTLRFGSITLTNHNTLFTSDVFMVKYDAVGALLSAESFGGSSQDAGRGVCADRAGNLFLSGSFMGSAAFGSTNLNSGGSSDAFLIKLTRKGDAPGPGTAPEFLWARRAGGPDADTQGGIAVDAYGNMYASGHFTTSISFGTTNLTSRGDVDAYLAKYDADGTFLWVHQIGGTATDTSTTVALDNANCVYVTGYITGTATIGSTNLTAEGAGDIYVAKYDSNGGFISAQKAGGTGPDHSIDMAIDAENNLYFGGYYRNTGTFGSLTTTVSCGSIRSDAYIAKYDSTGNAIWIATGASCHDDVTFAVVADASGNAFAAGYYRSNAVFSGMSAAHVDLQDVFVAKYNSHGTIQWVRTATGIGTDMAQAACADSGGNLYVTGVFQSNPLNFGSTNLPNVGGQDIFFAKYDSAGTLLWVRGIGSSGTDGVGAVLVDGAGDIFVAGSFQTTTSFGSTNLISQGGSDFFVAKYNSDGTLLWAKGWGTIGTDGASDLALDADGELYMSGIFSGGLLFGNDYLSSSGSTDAFVGKLGTNFVLRLPPLMVARSGESLVISWPNTFVGYTLQETSDLNVSWTNFSGAPAVINDTCVAAIAASGSKRFFRLIKQ